MAPQTICAYTFHLEHIIPRSAGGNNSHDNRALSCWNCNSSKSNRVDGTDPDSGVAVSLFDPRKQVWSDHFKWDSSFTLILGTTACGRATVAQLDMNAHSQQVARPLWIASGYWP